MLPRFSSLAALLLLLPACAGDRSETSSGTPWPGLEPETDPATTGSSAGDGDTTEPDADTEPGPAPDPDDGDPMTTGDTGVTGGIPDVNEDPPNADGSCGAGGAHSDGDTFELGPSWYQLWAPTTALEQPLPLIVGLHGDGGLPDYIGTYFYNWGSRQDYILVAPKAEGGSWRTGDLDAKAEFLMDVLVDVASQYNVDVNRVYAIGYSGGSTFLGWRGFEFQGVFAAIQWTCGGAGADYTPPPTAACKVPGRFSIAPDDFLYGGARSVHDEMAAAGHETEWYDATCSGHCCFEQGGGEFGYHALEWFLEHTKCGSSVGAGCHDLDDIP